MTQARLYSFAVISDTHINPDEAKCNSPFPVNGRANRRFRHVVSDLNHRDIDFVVHLGDLVHPVPDTGDLYHAAAQAYRDIVADLKVPIHILPGNHDIGDTPIKGAPADPVTPAMIEAWSGEFGPQFRAFSHRGVRFIKLNAQLINSGLPDEQIQMDWVETELAKAGERVFLMLHHPPYICSPDEAEHYDNTDQPGRDWLLGLLDRYGVEAMFAGHAHNFWYDRIGDTDYYLAPSTCFVRQDYSEMFRTAPPENSEFGRDDSAKLGYFIVKVYEDGHSLQFVRSFGAELGLGETIAAPSVLAPAPRENARPLIGFDLRQNWAEISEVPPSGGLDEFDRKLVRNDYPLLALMEMGVRNVRIPLADLRDPVRFARLGMLRHLGFRPTLFSFDVPSEADMALIVKAGDRLVDWEITIDWSTFAQRIPVLHDAHKRSSLPIFVSRLRTKSDLPSDGVYYHVINHGFSAGDAQQLAALAEHTEEGIAGAVFRLGWQEPVADTIASIDDQATRIGIQSSVHLRLARDNPASATCDSAMACQRVMEAMKAARSVQATRVFCDALVEADRGYFPRTGAIDRNGNPTEIHNLVKSQHSEVLHTKTERIHDDQYVSAVINNATV